jgi:hypothetical protein
MLRKAGPIHRMGAAAVGSLQADWPVSWATENLNNCSD